jgi:hypothetical protein
VEGKVIALRYPGVCAICGAAIARGDKASWHEESHTVTCLTCAASPASTTSKAGRSAERKAERLEARAPSSAIARWTRGGPSESDLWHKGAEGEEIVGARLDALRDEGMIVRHDLRVPGSRAANIDHVVVARSGIHVIDSKFWNGQIRLKKKGIVGDDWRLYVNSRDRTSAVEKLAGQILAVDHATKELGLPTPITAAICFVKGDWPVFTRGYTLHGVQIVWPKKLVELLRRPGPLTDDQMAHAGQLIFERLPLG